MYDFSQMLTFFFLTIFYSNEAVYNLYDLRYIIVMRYYSNPHSFNFGKSMETVETKSDQSIEEAPWSKGVRFAHATPKFSFLQWLVMNNKLATGDRMKQWNANADDNNVICQGMKECHQHLFFFSNALFLGTYMELANSGDSEDWSSLTQFISDTTFAKTELFHMCYTIKFSIKL